MMGGGDDGKGRGLGKGRGYERGRIMGGKGKLEAMKNERRWRIVGEGE